MSEDVPGFQALPGATPENSAFIDLYFNPSVSLPGKSTVSIKINDWQLRLSVGQSVRIAVPPGVVSVVVHCSMAFLTPKPRLRFAVQPGQVVPVFYRASRLKNNPGSLTFQRLEGLSPSERNDLTTMKIMFAVFLGMTLMAIIPIALFFWFMNSLGAP